MTVALSSAIWNSIKTLREMAEESQHMARATGEKGYEILANDFEGNAADAYEKMLSETVNVHMHKWAIAYQEMAALLEEAVQDILNHDHEAKMAAGG